MGQPVSAVHDFPNALHRQLGEGAPQVVGSYGRADLGSARAINCSRSRALAGSRSRNRVDVAAVAGHRRVRAADQCPADVVGSGGHGAPIVMEQHRTADAVAGTSLVWVSDQHCPRRTGDGHSSGHRRATECEEGGCLCHRPGLTRRQAWQAGGLCRRTDAARPAWGTLYGT